MLKAESLSYHWQERRLIENISLAFAPGILYAILGPNGSGKSTFLKTLTGIWKPTSGTVLWKGRDLLSRDRREISKTITLVPQTTSLAFDFSALEIVTMGRYSHERWQTKAAPIIEQALHTVDAWNLRNRSMTELSSGERQRVYIARALVTESPVLLLDEPTANLDIRHQLEIWHLLKTLAENGKVILVANHDLITSERFCDQVCVLHHGSCVAKGAFANVVTPQLLHDVYGLIEYPAVRVARNYESRLRQISNN